jgi:hypothetical protein
VVWQKLTDVSEVFTVSIIRVVSVAPLKVGQFLRDYARNIPEDGHVQLCVYCL